MKNLRIMLPVLALAAIASAGCMLISGQFVVSFDLPTPFNAQGTATLSSVNVDLNTISEYSDHKDELKRIDDLALVGDFRNNSLSASTVYCWIVPSGAANLSQAQLQTQGVLLWGPLPLGVGETKKVDWNASAALFKGRQTLIDEIKGDGVFRLYLSNTSGIATQPSTAPAGAAPLFDYTITNGALIAVIGAAK
jgi:hypothetical protein